MKRSPKFGPDGSRTNFRCLKSRPEASGPNFHCACATQESRKFGPARSGPNFFGQNIAKIRPRHRQVRGGAVSGFACFACLLTCNGKIGLYSDAGGVSPSREWEVNGHREFQMIRASPHPLRMSPHIFRSGGARPELACRQAGGSEPCRRPTRRRHGIR